MPALLILSNVFGVQRTISVEHPAQGLGIRMKCFLKQYQIIGWGLFLCLFYGEISWRREWLPTPAFLPGESHRQISLESYSLRGHKVWDRTKQLTLSLGFPGDANGKEPRCGFNPGSGRSPGGGNGNPLQYSCLENPMDRGDWQATDPRVAKSQT